MRVEHGSFRKSPLPLPPHCRKPFSLKSSVIDSPCGNIWFGVAASGYGFINSVPHHRRRVHEQRTRRNTDIAVSVAATAFSQKPDLSLAPQKPGRGAVGSGRSSKRSIRLATNSSGSVGSKK